MKLKWRRWSFDVNPHRHMEYGFTFRITLLHPTVPFWLYFNLFSFAIAILVLYNGSQEYRDKYCWVNLNHRMKESRGVV